MYNAQETKNRIKSLCKSKKINIKSLLTKCELGINAIQQINDKKGMASYSLACIADQLDCSVDYLLGRTEKPSSTVTNIEGNVTGNAVVQSLHNENVTVTSGANALTAEETELLRLFQPLDVKRRVKILNFCYSLEEEEVATG